MDFCIYDNVDEKYFPLFDYYWEKYARQLPSLSTLLHNEKESRATVFNCWIRYVYFEQLLILKYEKAITHSFPDYLSTWLKIHMPDNIKQLIIQKQPNTEYLFFFSYNLSRFLLLDMEQFLLTKHPCLKSYLRPEDYYISCERTLKADDPIFKVIKTYIVHYVNIDLNTEKCATLFFLVQQHTTEQLEKIAQV